MRTIYLWLVVILTLGILPLAAQKTMYDQNVEVRNVGSFSAIHVSSSFNVHISQSATHALAVSVSDVKLRDAIKTEVKGGTLYIDFKPTGFDKWNAKKLTAYISVPELNKIHAAGACNIIIEGTLKVENLDVSINGASDWRGRVEAENLKIGASGSSDYLISGKANNLKIEVNGSSDVKGFDFVADYCEIRSSGASDVQITVLKEMKVNVSGASDVVYKGNPVVREANTSGASSLKRRE